MGLAHCYGLHPMCGDGNGRIVLCYANQVNGLTHAEYRLLSKPVAASIMRRQFLRLPGTALSHPGSPDGQTGLVRSLAHRRWTMHSLL